MVKHSSQTEYVKIMTAVTMEYFEGSLSAGMFSDDAFDAMMIRM